MLLPKGSVASLVSSTSQSDRQARLPVLSTSASHSCEILCEKDAFGRGKVLWANRLGGRLRWSEEAGVHARREGPASLQNASIPVEYAQNERVRWKSGKAD